MDAYQVLSGTRPTLIAGAIALAELAQTAGAFRYLLETMDDDDPEFDVIMASYDQLQRRIETEGELFLLEMERR